jgi:hypothetical protein
MRAAGLIAALLVAASAFADEPAPQPVPNPILEPSQRWAFDGFSILPPQENGWYSLAKTRTRAVLVKLGPGGESNTFATVVADRLDGPMPTPEAFLETMRARRGRGVDAARVAAVRHDESLESESQPWCTRYRMRADEVVPWYASAQVTEVLGRACLHPQMPGVVVDAAYAVRVPFGDASGSAPEVAARFLAGLQLLPAPTVPASLQEVTEAARAGDAAAAYRLGAMYERGRGVEASAQEAERWYRAAAQEGEADALYNLGALLERGGPGRERDARMAAEYFRRASDQRDAQAQLNLGLLYYKGDGVARDLLQARAFLLLAAMNGSERARDLMDKLPFGDPRSPKPSAEVAP